MHFAISIIHCTYYSVICSYAQLSSPMQLQFRLHLASVLLYPPLIAGIMVSLLAVVLLLMGGVLVVVEMMRRMRKMKEISQSLSLKSRIQPTQRRCLC